MKRLYVSGAAKRKKEEKQYFIANLPLANNVSNGSTSLAAVASTTTVFYGK